MCKNFLHLFSAVTNLIPQKKRSLERKLAHNSEAPNPKLRDLISWCFPCWKSPEEIPWEMRSMFMCVTACVSVYVCVVYVVCGVCVRMRMRTHMCTLIFLLTVLPHSDGLIQSSPPLKGFTSSQHHSQIRVSHSPWTSQCASNCRMISEGKSHVQIIR